MSRPASAIPRSSLQFFRKQLKTEHLICTHTDLLVSYAEDVKQLHELYQTALRELNLDRTKRVKAAEERRLNEMGG